MAYADDCNLAAVFSSLGIMPNLPDESIQGVPLTSPGAERRRNIRRDEDELFAMAKTTVLTSRDHHLREQDLPPAKVSEPSKAEVIAQMEFARELDARQAQSPTVRQTLIGMRPKHSRKSLEELQPISVSQLTLRTRHKGKFLLCRVVHKIGKPVGINIAVEDPNGDATRLVLFHFPSALDATISNLEALFPPGAFLAIREPTYKRAYENGFYMVRIPTPSDVVFLDQQSELVKSVTWKYNVAGPQRPNTLAEWKNLGNEHFKRKEWLCAAIAYTEGLKSEPRNHLLLLNRAAAYLELHWNNSAAHDADAVIAMNLDDPALKRKAVYRATKAYYAAGKYVKVTQLSKLLPGDSDIKTLSTKTSHRLRERNQGVFDWWSLYAQSRVAAARPDVASYQGPVEVRLSPGGESFSTRGLFTTRAIKQGDLLFVAKPIASYYPEDKPPHPTSELEVFLTYNFLTDALGNRSSFALADRVVNRVWDDANTARTLDSMNAGSRFPPKTDYPSAFVPPSPLTDPRKPAIDIDIDRIEGMCTMNAFRLEDAASHAFFGDVMVVRATKTMRAGEEVTLNYFNDIPSYEERTAFMERKWGAPCDCVLCKADRADSPGGRLDRAEVVQHLPTDESGIVGVQHRVAELKVSYRDTPERRLCGLKPELCKAYGKLGLLYQSTAIATNSKFFHTKSAEAFMDALEALGVGIQDRSVSGRITTVTTPPECPVDVLRPIPFPRISVPLMMLMSGVFTALGQETRSLHWMQSAMWVEGQWVGTLVGENNGMYFMDKYNL
ncbi:hypothetical protein EUX98_g6184 [Antrodiella citrinella]|uniref:SET domain-containing protein n=1 Tax=Antrodiella citrinella TaxID=2447956 RepID=A0A4S4MS93_9APHY|nr:hypothetical protein EUX98_g6184 [Antrodiella citrinella]